MNPIGVDVVEGVFGHVNRLRGLGFGNYATDVDSALEHHSTGVTAIRQCDISIVEWNS